jgi:hypothetical protein
MLYPKDIQSSLRILVGKPAAIQHKLANMSKLLVRLFLYIDCLDRKVMDYKDPRDWIEQLRLTKPNTNL